MVAPSLTLPTASLTHLPHLWPSEVMLNWAFRSCEHPRGRIPTINVAAKYCKTPNSPICVLPPERENSLRRHSLIWQANSKPYWQPQACFPNQTAMEPKIAPACDMLKGDLAKPLSLQGEGCPHRERSPGTPGSCWCQGRPACPPVAATTAGVRCSFFLTQNTPTKKLLENTHRSVKSTLSNSNKGGKSGNTSNPFAADIFLLQDHTKLGRHQALSPASKRTSKPPNPCFPFPGISLHFFLAFQVLNTQALHLCYC